MTLSVRCAHPGCTAVAAMPSSADVFGDADPFDTARPISEGTGWRSWADRYWCPAHRSAPDEHTARRSEWRGRRDLAMAEWEAANPPPVVPGEAWHP